MDNKGRNDGFRVLEVFVCEAIPSLDIPQADEQHRGRNACLLVVEGLSFDASCEEPSSEEIQDPYSRSTYRPAVLDDSIKSEAGRVAAIISGSVDPPGSLDQFQKLLLAELDSMQKSAAAVLERGRANNGSGSGDVRAAEPGTTADRPRD